MNQHEPCFKIEISFEDEIKIVLIYQNISPESIFSSEIKYGKIANLYILEIILLISHLKCKLVLIFRFAFRIV